MKPQILIVFALSVFLVAGCQLDDNEIVTDAKGLLKRVDDEKGETIAEYTYQRNGTLITSKEFNDFYSPGKHAEFKYTFDNEGRLTAKNGFEPGNMVMSSMTGAMDKYVTIGYEYDSENRISRIHSSYHYDELPDIDYETNLAFEYPDHRMVRTSFNHIRAEANTIISSTDYLFDKNGNIEELISYYSENNVKRITYKETYTYDDQNKPFDFNPGPQSVNNVLSKMMTAYNYDDKGTQSVAYESEYTYEYTYYRNGYPKSVAEIWPNEMVNTKYFYYK